MPFVLAQDAEGESAGGLGGWGLGVSFPDFPKLLEVLSEALGRGLPGSWEMAVSCGSVREWTGLSDRHIPEEWTSGKLAWRDFLATSHSYKGHIHVYGARVLVISHEAVSKIVAARNSRL